MKVVDRTIGNRIAHSVSEVWRRLQGAPAGQVYTYDPTIDSDRGVTTGSLTFSKLNTILTSGADGTDIKEALQLFEAVEREDGRVRSVAGTRRRAVTGLEWEIVSAADKHDRLDKGLADEAAAYCRERLDGLRSFKQAIKHLAKAIGPNLAVLELIWQYCELIELTPIPTWRLTMKPHESLDIRVITADERTHGVVATAPKFVVHIPEGMDASPIGRAIAYPQAFVYLLKRLARSDWGAFCEIFGMPIRVGKYRAGASLTEKTAMRDMLKNIGTRAWAMFQEGNLIEIIESSQRTAAPYETFINFLNRETGVLWLGANLTSDTTGGTGTFAAAAVQDDLREDIRDDDIETEADTVREQILDPMCRYKFAGRNVPVPYFERTKPEDSTKIAANVTAWQKTGLKIPVAWARTKAGIPKPKDGEAVLEPADAYEAGLTEDIGATA